MKARLAKIAVTAIKYAITTFGESVAHAALERYRREKEAEKTSARTPWRKG